MADRTTFFIVWYLTKGGFPIEIKSKISKHITYSLAIFII